LRVDSPESSREVLLASAPPKGDRLRWLVEKATELGVARLVLLKTQHTIVEPGLSRLERIRATVIEACKQSGRNRLMAVEGPVEWQPFLDMAVRGRPAFMADPSGDPVRRALDSLDRDRPIVLAVGPEGGFTAAELEQGQAAGAALVSLGARVLRIETAALALAALFVNR
jgi:16S rRNA (uracil1498-N3)-methyltransferase